MKWYNWNIEKLTLENKNFRQVLYTAKNMQLVLMTLKPGEDIWMEIHEENDQFFRFESGEWKVLIDWNEYKVEDGSAIIIPMWSEHNVINTSDSEDLTLYTIYATPHHKDQIIRKTKEEAMENEEDFDWETTE